MLLPEGVLRSHELLGCLGKSFQALRLFVILRMLPAFAGTKLAVVVPFSPATVMGQVTPSAGRAGGPAPRLATNIGVPKVTATYWAVLLSIALNKTPMTRITFWAASKKFVSGHGP